MSEAAIRGRIADASGWQVQRQLGRGQYGTAYLVEWAGKKPSGEGDAEADDGDATDSTAVGDQAVAKVVGLEFLPEKEHNLAFQEVEMMRNLNHPHIVALQDHFMTEASLELVIVMEFCDSGDLRGEVKWRHNTKPPSHIPEDQIMTWFVQLTQALNYMHHRHILHRDLKSSNVFLTENDSKGHDVKIGDFGISRVLEGTVDVAATVVGTPYYMSPEVCKSEPYGFKSDIWALGCVLYEMCMLKHAFESQSLLGLVYKIVSETYDPIPSQYSQDLRTLIDRVLDKSHFNRPSGKDLIALPYFRRFDKLAGATDGSTVSSPVKGSLQGAQPPGTVPDPQPAAPAAAPAAVPPPPGRKASLAPKASPLKSGPPRRTSEPAPKPPTVDGPGPGEKGVEEQPARREWCAPPFVAAAVPSAKPGGQKLDEGELRAQALLSRIRRALRVRRQNWLQVFASFDHKGDGQLQEADFERAVQSMALGLSEQEIREVRRYLQGSGATFVNADRFQAALAQEANMEILQLEDWGRTVLSDLCREGAKRDGGSGGAGPGASVRVVGLQSAAGSKLNGSEGLVDKWDAMSCRWVVKVSDGSVKSIRNENLQVLRPASQAQPSGASGAPETACLFRLLCDGGETAVLPDRFLSVVSTLMPKLDEGQQKQLLLLLPKSPEGRVDVPEVLAQLVAPAMGDQTMRFSPGPSLLGSPSPNRVRPTAGAGPLMPGFPGAPGPLMQPPPSWVSPMKGKMPMKGPTTLSPGPPSRVSGTSPRGPGSIMMGPTGGSADFRGERARAEVALLRLAQRLWGARIGRGPPSGPGLDALRLFASRPEEICLEEFSDAASLLPIGISRAEVQVVFGLIRENAASMVGASQNSQALTFSQLVAATEAARSAGVPSEAGLEYVDFNRLAPALQRLAAGSKSGCSGRVSDQEFRVALMQAEPYLTRSQLEWLMMLTDKDGEGRLLPWSLLTRLADARAPGGHGAAAAQGHGVRVGGIEADMVPHCPAQSSSGPVAPTVPRHLVSTAICSRIRLQLFNAGPQLGLDNVLGLFDTVAAGEKVSRAVLSSLLGHLHLGISIAEADEIIGQLVGASLGGTQVGIRVGDGDTVQLPRLYEMLQRAHDPDQEATMGQLREAARQRLLGCGGALVAAASAQSEGAEWIPGADFQRCLSAALLEDPMGALTAEEEDRLFLLAEKSASGDVRWRAFAQSYTAWQDLDLISEEGKAGVYRSPASPVGARGQSRPSLRTTVENERAHTSTQQSWRSAKTAPPRSSVAQANRTELPVGPDSPPPARVGFCRCRKRYAAGYGA